MAQNMVTAAMMPRQANVNPGAIAGCTSYNFEAVDSCINNINYAAYPTCIDWQSSGCCTSYLSVYSGEFGCLQSAYSNCFDFTDYLSALSDFFPCFSGAAFATTSQKKPNNSPATTTPIPQLSFEPITYGTPTSTPLHAAISRYTGSGHLLQGYCNTPQYVLLDGPTAYWAPLVGCADGKTDCCPFQARETSSGTSAVTVVSTITIDVGPGGVGTAYSGLYGYPQADNSQSATLKHCPEDYVTVSGGCCPSGYQLWNAAIGGAVPCYSSLMNTLTPPVVPIPGVATTASSAAASSGNLLTTMTTSSNYSPTDSKPTSAVVNVVYAIQYPVAPKSGLPTGAKVGIGAGVGAGGLLIIILGLLLIRKYRHSKRDKETIAALSTAAADSHSESQAAMSSASPYAYSTRTELHSDGLGAAQTPNSAFTAPVYPSAAQNGYFPTSNGNYNTLQPTTMMAPGQPIQRRPVPGQEMQYSPHPSTVSPGAGSDGQSFQAGHVGPPPQWSPHQQNGVSLPPQQQHGYQPPQEMSATQSMSQQQYYQQPQELSAAVPPYELPQESHQRESAS